MFNTVIVDDKQANIHTLSDLLAGYCPHVTIAGTATGIDAAYELILRLRPSVVFLDIEMPGGNGFDLLRKFRTVTFEVIFTTAYDQYAIQAFRENALDYLLKPIDIDVLQQAVQKAEEQVALKQSNQRIAQYLEQLQQAPVPAKISLPVQEGYLFMACDDIVRCEASGSYSHFYTIDGKKIVVCLRLKECEDLFPASFFRVHHSHIINLRYVNRYYRGRGGYVQMEDGSTVEVAASKKDAFLAMVQHRF